MGTAPTTTPPVRTSAQAFAERASELQVLLLSIDALLQDRVENAPRDWADVGDLATAAAELEQVRTLLAGE